jgi:hypothetical protein
MAQNGHCVITYFRGRKGADGTLQLDLGEAYDSFAKVIARPASPAATRFSTSAAWAR